MTNSITTIIYSYKGKLLLDVIENLLKLSSGKYEIKVIVFDQNPLLRDQLLNNNSITYHHIFWDWIHSPLLYKDNVIKNINTKYTMLLSDNVLLSDNWDTKFIDFIDNQNIIISGNHDCKLEQDNLFYLKKNSNDIDNFTLTQYIDRSLIFCHTALIQEITYPNYLKFFGEEEVLSAEFFTFGSDIFACPTKTYTVVGDSTIKNLYVPFSLNHNYNEAIKLVKTGINSFSNLTNKKRSIGDFISFHNNIFKNLKPLPFYTNDVNYHPEQLDFEKIDARRFVARTRAIR